MRFPYVQVFEKGGIQISLIGYRGIAFPFLILHTVSKESFFDAFVCMLERKSGECSKKKYRRAGKRDVFERIFHPVQAD